MSLFAIGDTHLSFGTDKPMNIFRGWDNYVERLRENWIKLVSENDTVVVMGDISWGMSLEESLQDFIFLNNLPGRKIVLKGNHDYWWNTRAKMEKFFCENGLNTISVLHNNSFKVENISVCGTRGWFFDAEDDKDKKVIFREAERLKRSIEYGRKLSNEPVVFLHYPPVNNFQKCEVIYNVLLEEKIKRCYYAHLHSISANNSFNGFSDGIKFELLSCDYLKFCPKLIEK